MLKWTARGNDVLTPLPFSTSCKRNSSSTMQPHLKRYLCKNFHQNLEGFKKQCSVKQTSEDRSASWSAGYEILLASHSLEHAILLLYIFLKGLRRGETAPKHLVRKTVRPRTLSLLIHLLSCFSCAVKSAAVPSACPAVFPKYTQRVKALPPSPPPEVCKGKSC